MNKEEKNALVATLTEALKNYAHFYVVDIAGLNADVTSKLRRTCFEKEMKLMMVKNTIFVKTLQGISDAYKELDPVMKGSSAVLFSNTGNAPAKLIKEFALANGKPVFKGAYVEESVYVGADQLDALVAIKSKEELLGDVITLLQSPAKNVISALQGGGGKIHGILETLSKK